ncbi:MAG TPA: hypothetical protein VFA93_00375, partial [Patescibacteria group bacterium]|nr:hypothetical protein [Patescibacteria group bacterium]
MTAERKTGEFEINPTVAKGMESMKKRIDEFRKTSKPSERPHPSSLLGYIANGSEKGYIPDVKGDHIELHPNLIGELFLGAITDFRLERTTDIVSYGEDGKAG